MNEDGCLRYTARLDIDIDCHVYLDCYENPVPLILTH